MRKILGMPGEEEEQPASRRAGKGTLVENDGDVEATALALTKEDYGDGDKYHEHMVVTEEWNQPWRMSVGARAVWGVSHGKERTLHSH